MAQTSFGFSGRFCPMIRPLFHGSRLLTWKLQHSVTDMVVSSRADHTLLNANIELANIDTDCPLWVDSGHSKSLNRLVRFGQDFIGQWRHLGEWHNH
jgi:hypothetical protein